MLKLNQFVGYALLIGLVSCTSSPKSTVDNRNKPLVVATTSVLCDLTKQIAQESIDLQCLVDAGVDPHVYQPTPEDRKAIDEAQLILYGGYNFDANLVKLIEATGNSVLKVAVHEIAVPDPLKGGSDEIIVMKRKQPPLKRHLIPMCGIIRIMVSLWSM